MWQLYLRERRVDSLRLVFPILTVILLIVGVFAAVVIGSNSGTEPWSIWVAVIVSPLTLALIWRLVRHDER